MIKTKSEYKYYLTQDAKALGKKRKSPSFIGDDIWKFQRLMRLCEYSMSWKGVGKILSSILRYRFYLMSIKLNYSIPLNTFGPGLALIHRGPVVVSPYAKIGKNCRLQTMTCIGATNGIKKAPVIGDNVYIAVGAKIIGDITIANNVVVGAGAVVVKPVDTDGVTVGGIPAEIISKNNSSLHLSDGLIS